MPEFDMIVCIVNNGHGSKALKIAKNHGIKGGTIFFGKGTVRSKLLEFLELNDVKKEIVLMVASRETATEAAQALNKGMSFHKPNHGIAFVLPISNMFGSKEYGNIICPEDRMVTDSMYNAIFTVVDRGRGEDVVEASKAAGARGATIIHARGSGIHETEMLFAMQIEPEKDVVLILAKNDICADIISSIREKLDIDSPGAGIVFSLCVSETYGLY